MQETAGAAARDYLRRLDEAPRHRVDRHRDRAPIEALQSAALGDADAWVRARCLGVLDHVANDASTHVFVAALQDPVADVRAAALHGLSCERCRTSEVCVVDVVGHVIETYEREPSAELRHRLVTVLGRFAGRSDEARRRLDDLAAADPDPLLRHAAERALTVGHVRSRKALRRLARSAERRTRQRSRSRRDPLA